MTTTNPARAEGVDYAAGDLNDTTATAADPELPKPGSYSDLETAGKIADYALVKLRRYVDGSTGEISSHFIELSIRLGELYARLGEALLGQPGQAVAAEPKADQPQSQFALEATEAAQLAVEEGTG